ncbi:hypothetical protein ADZ36_23585 [Streptomyces fradiae]|nr:hypothetical protein ADZ36_23585 [Streptomyces fradiae]OFA50961.1 hypothetical protein BEN35_15140 [Streptomyces fradiae]
MQTRSASTGGCRFLDDPQLLSASPHGGRRHQITGKEGDMEIMSGIIIAAGTIIAAVITTREK